jgi:hypothetical protein
MSALLLDGLANAQSGINMIMTECIQSIQIHSEEGEKISLTEALRIKR